jgi:predicted esterase YcpF (UPF0227 family)
MLYYIHGYMSEPNSTKGTLLKKTLNVQPVKYRDCPPEQLIISECVNNIKKTIENDQNTILIGSSLGGLLAVKTAKNNPNVKQLILLNPAIIPPDYDINQIQGMPYNILKDMQDPGLFNEKIKTKIDLILGTQDDVVPNSWGIKFAEIQQAKLHFLEDDHGLTQNLEKLPEIIKQITG